MTEHQPPIVLECPTCGEKYLVSRDTFVPSEKTIRYSDGYFTDELNWRTPGIIGCVTCELGFLPEKGKVVVTPDWDDFYQNWSHLTQAHPPAPGALALELRARRNMDTETEIIIRKEFWYSANHTETGRALMANNVKFKNYWIASLERFEELLDLNNPDERLLKAEVNRQLGRFELCIEIIDKAGGEIALVIRKAATNNEVNVIKVE
jgi:hypothetical protein